MHSIVKVIIFVLLPLLIIKAMVMICHFLLEVSFSQLILPLGYEKALDIVLLLTSLGSQNLLANVEVVYHRAISSCLLLRPWSDKLCFGFHCVSYFQVVRVGY